MLTASRANKPFPKEWLQIRMEAASLNTLDSFVGQLQLQAAEVQLITSNLNDMMADLQKRLSLNRWSDFSARFASVSTCTPRPQHPTRTLLLLGSSAHSPQGNAPLRSRAGADQPPLRAACQGRAAPRREGAVVPGARHLRGGTRDPRAGHGAAGTRRRRHRAACRPGSVFFRGPRLPAETLAGGGARRRRRHGAWPRWRKRWCATRPSATRTSAAARRARRRWRRSATCSSTASARRRGRTRTA